MSERMLRILLEGFAIALILIILGAIGASALALIGDGIKLSHAPKPHDTSPSWSPDGTEIAFSRVVKGKAQVYVMTSDGSDQVPVTSSSAHYRRVAWIASGRIAFVRGRSVWASNITGSVVRRLAGRLSALLAPAPRRALSPDRHQLAFVRDNSIYVGDARGRGAARLTGE